jgi:glycosyltransferase involved in cell wall biosynthesis
LECNNQKLAWNEFREPVKIREYMAYGLPVVSKEGHALVEEIRREGVGMIVRNLAEFIDALKFILSDETVYLTMRQKALALAERTDKEAVLRAIFERLGLLNGD